MAAKSPICKTYPDELFSIMSKSSKQKTKKIVPTNVKLVLSIRPFYDDCSFLFQSTITLKVISDNKQLKIIKIQNSMKTKDNKIF